jgi:hypothetical protein
MHNSSGEVNKLCIYHGNCLDGFGAAWAVHHALDGNVAFYKGIHQQPPPDVTGLDVYLVDLSDKKKLLQKNLKNAARNTNHDHHKSAEKDL